jgi:hypothetical protein
MHELRCATTMHGRMLDDTKLEVKCKRRACGHKPGVVVLHIFDVHTGMLLDTKKYADPQKGQVSYGSSEPGAAVRTA